MTLRSLLKGAFVLALAALAQGVVAGAVLADGGPHDISKTSGGGGAALSDVCATCHRAHQAAGSGLSTAAAQRELCFSCHSSSALGSKLDVSNGTLAGTHTGTKAGGVTTALMDTAWTGDAVARPVTSAHMIDGTKGTMWGAGAIGSGAGTPSVELGCVSCHDPHGNGSYRVLRPIPAGATGTEEIAVPDETVKAYGVTSTQNRYFGQIYLGGDYSAQVALDRWCAACHSRYDAPDANSATVSSGDPMFNYRHTTRMTDPVTGACGSCHTDAAGQGPVVNTLAITSQTAHVPVCENCHVAHGSAAQMSTQVGTQARPDGSKPAVGKIDSALLRLDSRGVCRACHGR